MGEFVNIESSAADVIALANQLRVEGMLLRGKLETLAGTIRSIGAGAFPADDYTGPARKQYEAASESLIKGMSEAADVIRDSGQAVANAMWTYLMGDDDNASGIAGVV